jgi:hypothetical protein
LLPGTVMVVASGSLPPGAPPDFYASVARMLAQRGVPLVLDTSGPALAAALQAGVHLIKPSLRELQELTGEPLADTSQRLAACRRLIERGATRLVALSLGPEGALLVRGLPGAGPGSPRGEHDRGGRQLCRRAGADDGCAGHAAGRLAPRDGNVRGRVAGAWNIPLPARGRGRAAAAGRGDTRLVARRPYCSEVSAGFGAMILTLKRSLSSA